MSRVSEFEQLLAWQKARQLNRLVFEATRRGPLALDRILREQLRSASISIMGNIAEGFDRAGRAEFHQFLSVAKGSAGEIRSHLYAAHDVGFLHREQFEELRSLAREVAALTNLLRKSVAKQRNRLRDKAAGWNRSP